MTTHFLLRLELIAVPLWRTTSIDIKFEFCNFVDSAGGVVGGPDFVPLFVVYNACPEGDL